jgi:hypothetical protein
MGSALEISLDNSIVMKYDRNTRLPGKQREFLAKMDFDMNEGINLNGKHYVSPDIVQRGQYVAINLIQAIQKNNRSMITAMCAYLVTRLPTLNQVIAEDNDDEVTINLYFDKLK